jgi:hypothetical protein
MTRPQRKRPITEALLHVEEDYRQARRKLSTIAAAIGSLRGCLAEGLRLAIEPHILVLETDMIRHQRELETIETKYSRSREIIYRKIEAKLNLHQGFIHFLFGFRDTRTGDCLLPMLDLGLETACSIKQRIAAFAGVPTGALLGDLRDSFRSATRNNDDFEIKKGSRDKRHLAENLSCKAKAMRLTYSK